MTVFVCAFYKFVEIADCASLQASLLARCEQGGVKGTILLAREGINATISAPDEAMTVFLSDLRSDERFTGLTVKQATAPNHPFQRLKVKVKREIIAFDPSADGPLTEVGTYVKPRDWNALIADPDVIVIDTRNAYEVAIGTFERALDPKTAAFSDFPAYAKANLDPQRDKKIAMFCTGGIRCEKASAHLIQMGFGEVYHLDGGILNYLEVIPPKQSLWHGECFVFDERVSVTHGNTPGTHVLCSDCGFPISANGAEARCENCDALQKHASHER
ncbi:MAG: rhodanese-related sulfurtransferase [Hyphomicrobiaceae bacterium]|nr:rhodanese-related sulfurtransferase [Hyphomicrobiaceae bacterium]